MSSFITPSRARGFGWFLAPLAAVGILAFTGGTEAPEYEEPEDEDAVLVRDTDRYAALPERTHVADHGAISDELLRLATIHADSPFVSDHAYQHEEPGDPVGYGGHATETPVFRLTSVMSGNAGTVCVINNEVKRVGDSLRDGWVVKTIDTSERRVVILSPSGQELVLSQH